MTGRRGAPTGAVLAGGPWAAVGTGTALAAALLWVADVAPDSAWMLATLAVAACGGVAAYVLDDPLAPVADATPAGRPRRAVWRLPMLAVPLGVGAAGLGLLPEHLWRLLAPVLVGLVALALATVAALRARGDVTPGDRTAVVLAILGWLALAATPLHRFVPVVPYDQAGSTTASRLMWAGVVAAALVVVVAASRDPAARHRRR